MLSNFRNYVVAVLRHKGGADAVESALIMALVEEYEKLDPVSSVNWLDKPISFSTRRQGTEQNGGVRK